MWALGIGPGDEVIVPAFMWVATVTTVIGSNAIPVLCEVDDSFNMDPNYLAAKITERTRLIATVHMAGAPCDMDAIMAVANEHDIYHNIRSLAEKVPLSPAGNPWSLPQNAESIFEYAKGACPTRDDLFDRSVIITIPSRLTAEQEREMAQAVRNAVAENAVS